MTTGGTTSEGDVLSQANPDETAHAGKRINASAREPLQLPSPTPGCGGCIVLGFQAPALDCLGTTGVIGMSTVVSPPRYKSVCQSLKPHATVPDVVHARCQSKIFALTM